MLRGTSHGGTSSSDAAGGDFRCDLRYLMGLKVVAGGACTAATGVVEGRLQLPPAGVGVAALGWALVDCAVYWRRCRASYDDRDRSGA